MKWTHNPVIPANAGTQVAWLLTNPADTTPFDPGAALFDLGPGLHGDDRDGGDSAEDDRA